MFQKFLLIELLERKVNVERSRLNINYFSHRYNIY